MGKVLITGQHTTLDGPSIFLAGPIQGAEDWQAKATDYIQHHAPEIHITSPRGPPEYYERRLTDDEANAQADWETKYLRRAADDGVILFWLATEKVHNCDRDFARTTREELFEWKVHYEIGGVDLVLGIEEGFGGARYIRKRFRDDCPELEIYDTLEDTCAQAVRLVRA